MVVACIGLQLIDLDQDRIIDKPNSLLKKDKPNMFYIFIIRTHKPKKVNTILHYSSHLLMHDVIESYQTQAIVQSRDWSTGMGHWSDGILYKYFKYES